MEKIKNLVAGGLQKKILNLVLFTIVLIVLVFFAAAIYQSNSLTSLFTNLNAAERSSSTRTAFLRRSMKMTSCLALGACWRS